MEGEEGEEGPLTTLSFGLFEGRKTRTRGGTCTRIVKCKNQLVFLVGLENLVKTLSENCCVHRGLQGRGVHVVLWRDQQCPEERY